MRNLIYIICPSLVFAAMSAEAAVKTTFDANNPSGSVTYVLQRKANGTGWPTTPVEPVAGPGTLVSKVSRASGSITATRGPIVSGDPASGYTVKASADFFQPTDKGRDLKFGANGPTTNIATYKDARTVVVSDQGAVAATTFTVSTDNLSLLDETVVGGEWVYRAYAKSGSLVSGFSNEVVVAVPLNAPSGLVVSVDLGSLVNLSARARAGTGDDALIVGVVTDGKPVQLLFAGVGPGLARYNVASPLARPRLRLMRGQQQIALNEGWMDDPLIAEARASVHAFPLDPGSLDAAMLVTLDPGLYTAICEPVDGVGGVALVETYLVR